MKTPYITYYIGHALYTNHEIDVDRLEKSTDAIETYRFEDPVFGDDGKITPKCRKALRKHGQVVSARTGLSLCVVYAEDECDYITPDGETVASDIVPYLMVRRDDGDHRYEIIGLPALVKGESPEKQLEWVHQIMHLQAATVRSISEE